MTDIDWRAVDFAVQGCRMRLTASERVMAVRRLRHRLMPAGSTGRWTKRPGELSLAELGALVGCVAETVIRTIADLPDATEQSCPVCGSQMWVHLDGLVEPHPDALMIQCPLSEYELPTVTDDDLVMLRVQWLASWQRQDPHGIAAHVSQLGQVDLAQLLLAALAVVPEVDADEFAALSEWAVSA